VKLTLNAPPYLLRLRDEAERMALTFPALLTADLKRYRAMAEAAVPPLSDWQNRALAHILDGIEAMDILSGIDDLPSAGRIAAEITDWSSRLTDYGEIEEAERLRKIVAGLQPLAIAGLLMRVR